ncbi:MAG: hypothetical protein KJ666_00895 [Bacteroidetes bacterium]|nr:hypothetical protein [Bacteroidota bacterium]MBU2585088.1 hypothetical protein [Bacteroidota bacterium]
MKKRSERKTAVKEDDMLAEYKFDYSKAKKNPYADKLAQEKIIYLDPDIAKIFPDSDSVNKALRAIISAYPQKKSKKVTAT